MSVFEHVKERVSVYSLILISELKSKSKFWFIVINCKFYEISKDAQ